MADLAREIGFTQISVSHEVSPLMKYVGRGDTTVVDAYLSPILRRYVAQVAGELPAGARLMFMQSNGGLADAARFQGKDSILSGPAGGVVGAVETARQAGLAKIIGFDMGGTSTDVSHYDGEFERAFETQVAGVRMRAPMMRIHTVAAGGGSILHYDGARFRVGPDSAGRQSGAGLLSPRRAAHRHRLQRHAGPHPGGFLPRMSSGPRPTSRSMPRPCARNSQALARRARQGPLGRADRRGLPHRRRREHGQCHQGDLHRARP